MSFSSERNSIRKVLIVKAASSGKIFSPRTILIFQSAFEDYHLPSFLICSGKDQDF